MRTSFVKRLGAPLLLGTLAVSVAACGSTVSAENFKGASHEVAQRISDFETDATAVDEQKLCQNDLAAAVLSRLKAAGSDCQTALKSQLAQIDKFNLSVESIQVTGSTATAHVKSTYSGKERLGTLQLVKEGKNWKIADLS